MADDLVEVVEALLGDFYGENLDWRVVLEGETLRMEAQVVGNTGEVSSLTFTSDGVRQVSSPQPFDAISCADALAPECRKKGR